MLNRNRLLKFISIIIFAYSSEVYANQYEPLSHINTLAQEYIKNNIIVEPDESVEVKLGEAAHELRLAKCNTPITINLPEGSAEQHVTTLEMTCTGNPSWHVFIPVNMKILTKVVTTKELIPSKSIITDDMLELSYRDKNSLYSGYYKNFSEVSGQTPVTTLIAGTVLTKKNIQQPVIINKNQNVSIISRRGNILVRAEGIAKSDGALNATIKVINASSKRVVDAIVINSSTVEVITS